MKDGRKRKWIWNELHFVILNMSMVIKPYKKLK